MADGQFKVEKFNHKCSVGTSADIPINELDGKTPVSTGYLNSSTSMQFVNVFGASDNYMLRATAFLYMDAARTVSATITSDDGSKWILNGTVLGSTNYDAGQKSITFNFKKGENKIVGLFAEISGGDDFTLKPSIDFKTIGTLRTESISDLRIKLNEILNIKNTKITTQNLKYGVEIFGTSGRVRQGNSYNMTTTPNITNVSISSVSGATHGFTLGSDGYYTSQNKAVASSYAMCKLNFTTTQKVTLKINYINYAEGSYDYGVFSKLDTMLAVGVDDTDTSTVQLSLKGQQYPDVKVLTYEVPIGTHFICVKFRKDGSVDKDNDCLKFKPVIEQIQIINEEVNAKAYFTEAALLADTTQLLGTLGAVIDENQNASVVYQMLENNTWKRLIDLRNAPQVFSTIEEMNQHTDFAENTLAIVYGTSYVGTYKLDSGVWTEIGDTNEEVEIMNSLNAIEGVIDEYEGVGGTDEEINTVLDQIIGGNE